MPAVHVTGAPVAPSGMDGLRCVLRRAYRSPMAVCGRSSIATWRNSVLSLCAPHWGQRSADDQAPQRWHLLCVRFGTTSLPVHRCRISTSSSANSNPIGSRWAPSRVAACALASCTCRPRRARGRRGPARSWRRNWKHAGLPHAPGRWSCPRFAWPGRRRRPARRTAGSTRCVRRNPCACCRRGSALRAGGAERTSFGARSLPAGRPVASDASSSVYNAWLHFSSGDRIRKAETGRCTLEPKVLNNGARVSVSWQGFQSE